jgi:hypothetical protein
MEDEKEVLRVTVVKDGKAYIDMYEALEMAAIEAAKRGISPWAAVVIGATAGAVGAGVVLALQAARKRGVQLPLIP